jgi:hypothetical protein
MTEYEPPTYNCAFCHGKIVTCNCERGFKTAVENSTIKEVIKHIEFWHIAGTFEGGACDRGYCECPKIIDSIKEEFGDLRDKD